MKTLICSQCFEPLTYKEQYYPGSSEPGYIVDPCCPSKDYVQDAENIIGEKESSLSYINELAEELIVLLEDKKDVKAAITIAEKIHFESK